MPDFLSLKVDPERENKINILVLGGLYASQSVGREMALRVARHLAHGKKAILFSQTLEISNSITCLETTELLRPSVPHTAVRSKPLGRLRYMQMGPKSVACVFDER